MWKGPPFISQTGLAVLWWNFKPKFQRNESNFGACTSGMKASLIRTHKKEPGRWLANGLSDIRTKANCLDTVPEKLDKSMWEMSLLVWRASLRKRWNHMMWVLSLTSSRKIHNTHLHDVKWDDDYPLRPTPKTSSNNTNSFEIVTR